MVIEKANKIVWVHLALLAVALIYSANNLIAKIAMPEFIGARGDDQTLIDGHGLGGGELIIYLIYVGVM